MRLGAVQLNRHAGQIVPFRPRYWTGKRRCHDLTCLWEHGTPQAEWNHGETSLQHRLQGRFFLVPFASNSKTQRLPYKRSKEGRACSGK
ncbi:hypothetical protein [Paenibacillus terreus]|uniref:hypothetical protein n=1 Tax=Paenibacillus terreus TaxID=1387834 RepID=UPI0035CD36C0